MSVDQADSLRQGHPIPFRSLSPEKFQDCVAALLRALYPNWTLVTLPDEGPDDGFDALFERPDGKLICVQCKRIERSLSQNTICEELLKIPKAYPEKSILVREHWFITTGKIDRKLQKLVNSGLSIPVNRFPLIERACAILPTIHDPPDSDAVKHYITGLENIVIWNGRTLESELAHLGPASQEILDQYFRLETRLREYPFPQFDFTNYLTNLEQFIKENAIQQFLDSGSELPGGIEAGMIRNAQVHGGSYKDLLGNELQNELIIVTGRPGIGKSYLARSIAMNAATQLLKESPLNDEDTIRKEPFPVFIRASNYAMSLDQTVHSALQISWGHWTSIPGNLLLIIDGIDELPNDATRAFANEVESILNRGRHGISALITVRTTGLRAPIKINSPARLFRLKEWSVAQVLTYANQRFSGHDPEDFMQGLFASKLIGLATVPLFARTLGDLFEQGEALGKSEGTALRNFVKLGFENAQKDFDLQDLLRHISFETFIKSVGQVAFQIKLSQYLGRIPRKVFEEKIVESLKIIRFNELFGSEILNSVILQDWISKAGLISLEGDFIEFVHPLIMDYLAAAGNEIPDNADFRRLVESNNWDKYLEYKLGLLEEDFQNEYARQIVQIDAPLAARAARFTDSHEIRNTMASLSERLLKSTDEYENLKGIAVIRNWGTLIHREILKTCAQRETLGHPARMCLAILGDRETIAVALKWCEEAEQFPGNMSGPAEAVWYRSDPTVALAVARSWWSANSETSIIAGELIALLGSETEREAVFGELLLAGDELRVLRLFDRLVKINPTKALDCLQIRMKSIRSNTYTFLIFQQRLIRYGRYFDPKELLEFFIRKEYKAIEDPHTLLQTYEAGIETLGAATISDDLIDYVEDALLKEPGHEALWRAVKVMCCFQQPLIDLAMVQLDRLAGSSDSIVVMEYLTEAAKNRSVRCSAKLANKFTETFRSNPDLLVGLIGRNSVRYLFASGAITEGVALFSAAIVHLHELADNVDTSETSNRVKKRIYPVDWAKLIPDFVEDLEEPILEEVFLWPIRRTGGEEALRCLARNIELAKVKDRILELPDFRLVDLLPFLPNSSYEPFMLEVLIRAFRFLLSQAALRDLTSIQLNVDTLYEAIDSWWSIDLVNRIVDVLLETKIFPVPGSLKEEQLVSLLWRSLAAGPLPADAIAKVEKDATEAPERWQRRVLNFWVGTMKSYPGNQQSASAES